MEPLFFYCLFYGADFEAVFVVKIRPILEVRIKRATVSVPTSGKKRKQSINPSEVNFAV